MYHGTEENLKSRKKIVEAFFSLLKEKDMSEITATDIVSRAGIARATYYRNFTSREDIIREYIDSLAAMIIPSHYDMDSYSVFDYAHVVEGFEKALTCFLSQKSYILTIYSSGFSNLLLDVMNQYIAEMAGDMPSRSKERYLLYYIAGAAVNVLIQWLKTGAEESPREIASVCADIMSRPILHS